MRIQRLITCLICGLALAVLMAACATTEPEDSADAPQDLDTTVTDADDGVPQEPDTQMASATKLDLDTLQADTPEGTLQAERVEDSYVGSIGEGRAIGIAPLDNDGNADQGSKQQIVVYLYDQEDLAVLIGKVGPEGTATLESDDLSDFDATVEVMMGDDAVSGTVTFPGEEPTPFTADAATGVAGVCWARGTDDDADVSGDWVILSDGRQWGCVCHPPFTSPCCSLQF